MTIDKFGRTLKSSEKDIKGPKGDGFKLTSDGDFDIDSKRLTNISDPVQPQDATTKKYVDSKCIQLDKDGYSLGNKRLKNIHSPTEDSDAVNLQTLKRQCLVRYEKTGFNAKNTPITHLSEPVAPSDAATKQFVEQFCAKAHYPITTNLANQQMMLNGLKDRTTKCEGLIASNRDYHDKNLKKFGVLLFNYINRKHSGRSAILPTAGKDDYLNWEVLFAIPSGEEEVEEIIESSNVDTGGILMSEEEVRRLHYTSKET